MAKQVSERSKPNAGKPSIRKVWSVNGHRLKRHKLLRDLVLIMIAPVLVYLMASLFTYSKDDPGWSQSGSAIVHNIGGKAGAWIADVLFQLCGFVAFLLPVALGVVSWIALFGSDQEE
ncbi:MAG TPA: DNA translocase FtsK 4TM domain-containing protein, partial [Xylella fastidiosa subsp. pauca]